MARTRSRSTAPPFPRPPLPPMEALAQPELPRGKAWVFEPKWDGFRCLAFKDRGDIFLQSKNGQPFNRYFPEIMDALRPLPASFVLDGELLVAHKGGLSFDHLLQRIHPAESRVRRLSRETPAIFVAFDCLANERRVSLLRRPFAERRAALERFFDRHGRRARVLHLSPQTHDFRVARRWFRDLRDVLDGVVAKDLTKPYEAGLRTGAMQKIKNIRTADCVVGGFRWSAKGHAIGSLLLGLYDDAGLLNHVGFVAAFDSQARRHLKEIVKPLLGGHGFTGTAPGGPSRWSRERTAQWIPLEPRLVVEVTYDHFTGGRFRHGTTFVRWRPDKSPRQCRLDQVRHESRSPLTFLR